MGKQKIKRIRSCKFQHDVGTGFRKNTHAARYGIYAVCYGLRQRTHEKHRYSANVAKMGKQQKDIQNNGAF